MEIQVINSPMESAVPLVPDDGLQFGRGVFETVLVLDRPLFLQEHMERMNHALTRLGLPVQVNPQEIMKKITDHNIQHCVLKIIVTRENTLLLTRPYPYADHNERTGFRLSVADSRRCSSNWLHGIKSLSYLENLLAREQAVQKGCHDALFLNEQDEITETSTANIFFVSGHILYTPDPACGLLPGILQQWVMKQTDVRYGRFSLSDLLAAQEVFVTNSLVGIMPVVDINGHAVAIGSVTHRLQHLYEQFIDLAGSL